MDGFEVVEELEEHHPGEQWQAIHVAIEALVLAQNLARRADQRGQVLAGGQRCFNFAGYARFLFGRDGFGGFGHRNEFSLLVNGGLQPRYGLFQAFHAAEMARGNFGRGTKSVERLHLHQVGQHIELDNAALDVLVEQ